MNKLLALPATLLSCLVIYLATDPGRLAFKNIDVGGHQLRMHISGQWGPAVVFEGGGSGGAGAPLEAWILVQPAVSKFARTVSYDRAGIGWSEPGPKPRDARQVARELHTALLNAHIDPPYILVGHSFGGPLNRVFAGIYPEEVAGMVLVDPTQEEFIDWNQAQSPKQETRKDEEWKEIEASLTQAHESHVPPGIPIVLITGMGPREFPRFVTDEQKKDYRAMKQVWLNYHRAWVNTLANGRHVITENSSHGVPFEEPELIINEIRKVVEQSGLTPDRH